jgi:TatD DNase family protein
MTSTTEPQLIDSHFHSFTMQKHGINFKEMASNNFGGTIKAGLDICTSPDDFKQHILLTENFPWIHWAVGIQSLDGAREDPMDLINRFVLYIRNPRVAAVGETGIDNYWKNVPKEEQEKLFRFHIDRAMDFGLPLIIHNREADEEVYTILSEKKPPNGGIMHCYSSNYKWAKKFMNLGFLISFAGNVTYKGSDDIRETAAKIPEDMILAETDAPFLSPQPVRKEKNHPGLIMHTYKELALLRRKSVEDLAEAIHTNFTQILHLD